MMLSWKDIVVTIIMVIAQLNLGLVYLSYKFLANQGSSLCVVVAYRMLFATLLYPPAIFIYERYLKKSTPNDEDQTTPNPTLIWSVIGLAFLCGFFGGVLSYNLSAVGLELSSSTTVAAISNLFPAITFVLAILFRMENINLHTRAGIAKVLGTVIAIAGTMTLSFYKGIVVEPAANKWEQAQFPLPKSQAPHVLNHHELLGVLAAFGSCIFSASSVVIEDKLLQKYPNPPRASGLIVGMGAFQCIVYAAIMDRKAYYWRIDFTISEVMILYMAIIVSGLMMVLTTWCIAEKRSFFVSIFSPMTLVMVAVVSPVVSDEPLYLGSLVGAILIFVGIYLVIWGKKDDNQQSIPEDQDSQSEA